MRAFFVEFMFSCGLEASSFFQSHTLALFASPVLSSRAKEFTLGPGHCSFLSDVNSSVNMCFVFFNVGCKLDTRQLRANQRLDERVPLQVLMSSSSSLLVPQSHHLSLHDWNSGDQLDSSNRLLVRKAPATNLDFGGRSMHRHRGLSKALLPSRIGVCLRPTPPRHGSAPVS